jgi:uncharacterized protein YdaU (DUF1376 family)
VSSRPWYAWFPADYRAKTSHLTFEQDGAYRRLLDAYYERRGPLPANRAALYRLTSAQDDRERKAIDAVAEEFFENGDGMLRHTRCDEQIAKEQSLHRAAVEAGRKGGLSQAQARLVARLDHPTLTPTPTPILTPTPTPRSNTLFADANSAWAEFWEAYPRKTAKQVALKAWKHVKATDIPAVMTALEKHKRTEQWGRGVIPHPATWLNQRRWEDETISVGPDLGQCMWNKDGSRDQKQPRCTMPGAEEIKGLVYCRKHKHLHGEKTR